MADRQLKLILNCFISFTLSIAISTSCRLRTGNCPDGETKHNEQPLKIEPNIGVHEEVSSTGPTEAPKRKKCCPYDFDSSLCQTVNDRILCGFNRNRGKFANNQEYRELSAGCRLRGGRVECGYVHAPYTNPRRPPAHQTQEPERDDYNDEYKKDATAEEMKPTSVVTNSQSTLLRLTEPVEPEKPHNKFPQTTTNPKNSPTRCVEISDRIVCRYF